MDSSISLPSFIAGAAVGAAVFSLIVLIVTNRILTARSSKHLKALKDQFIALCSHYLLSPITIIQTSVILLQEEGVGTTVEQRQKLYANIYRGQQRLWLLAEQFLMVEQLEGNDLNLAISVGNISDVVTQSVVAIDSFAREKNIIIRIFDDELHQVREARFDVRRMKLALAALLDNAVKFSPEHSEVVVRVTVEEQEFSIAISDQGVGMSHEILSHLGEGFYRGNSVYNFDFEGMGLGTYIAGQIIRLHGGLIEYASELKKGSTVTIHLPIE